jgi:hypothetical protein
MGWRPVERRKLGRELNLSRSMRMQMGAGNVNEKSVHSVIDLQKHIKDRNLIDIRRSLERLNN